MCPQVPGKEGKGIGGEECVPLPKYRERKEKGLKGKNVPGSLIFCVFPLVMLMVAVRFKSTVKRLQELKLEI